MSWQPAPEPRCDDPDAARTAADKVITGRERDLGGFSVRRVLPAAAQKMVSWFTFFDQMGPATLGAGHGIDVRPHPHIGLATVTFLFEGEIVHRDSLGTHQVIRPGEVNWMTAGRGIVHSERTGSELRAAGSALHGIQAWVALPRTDEEMEPAFAHHDGNALPVVGKGGARLTLIAGSGWGERSPVETRGDLFYAAVELAPGACVRLPDGVEERAFYVAAGEVEHGGVSHGPGEMPVFLAGARAAHVVVTARAPSRVLLIGGEPADAPRFIEWNFVSSRAERIEQAKAAWRAEEFPLVPGDDRERIPLP